MFPSGPRRGGDWRIINSAFAAILLSACASARVPATDSPVPVSGQYHTSIVLDSSAAATRSSALKAGDTSAMGRLPVLSVSQLSEGGVPVRHIQLLDAGDQDLPIVLRGLAESFGLNYQIDSDVHGTVQTKLQDVTLEQALDAIVLPQGYSYTIDNGILRVGVARMQTRIFTLDYVALSRFATTSTTVQRQIGGGGNVSAGSIGGNIGSTSGGGADQISSVSVTDLWDELRVALTALVFDASAGRARGDTTSGGTTTSGVGAGGVGGEGIAGGGGGARSFSRVDADGRRLIINPMAGTIVITAPPAKLAEVATFMTAFEGSVQRQVLIEAKIVSVDLNKTSQFGIDWGQVSKINNLNLGVATTTAPSSGTITLTLGGGGTKINVVLRALESQGTVTVLSSPRVSAMNNVRATFNVTTDRVFFVVTSTPITNANGVVGTNQQVTPQTISVGIVLDVLPQIAADNTITMNIRPHVTSVLDMAQFQLENGGLISVPEVQDRETDTIVRARAGETIVIGGLMENSIDNTVTGVPGLQSLPIVGGLFKGRSNTTTKSELVIFITPTIVVGQPPIGQ